MVVAVLLGPVRSAGRLAIIVARTTKKWELTAAALHRLMLRLDPNPAIAGEKYEHLRRALLKFFRWHGESEAEAAVDETFDRLAHRLEDGQTIDDVPTFAYGVARFVRLERRRTAAALSVTRDETLVNRIAAVSPDAEDLLAACLETCLNRLPADERALIVGYYVGEGRPKIDHRARLARALGLSDNALRHRVQRLREQLKACATRCAESERPAAKGNESRHIRPISDSRKQGSR